MFCSLVVCLCNSKDNGKRVSRLGLTSVWSLGIARVSLQDRSQRYVLNIISNYEVKKEKGISASANLLLFLFFFGKKEIPIIDRSARIRVAVNL